MTTFEQQQSELYEGWCEQVTRIVADALSAQARLKPGGECVKYARIAIRALRDAGVGFTQPEPLDGMKDGAE